MFNPQLATFVCVADCGSFSQAAEKLYLSSTAVMKQLNALERHLELKLLERTRRGTVLTPAGEVIYRYARQMFADSERALREARAAAQAARSAFCVGTSILNPCRPFMDLWYRFCGHFPGQPVMPGVLILEALAQTGAVAALSLPENKGKLALFGGIKNARFRKQVTPGDVLTLHCELVEQRGPVGVGKASAYVDGKCAATAELTFVLTEAQ